MFSLRDFWRRHKRKIYVTLGVVGSGYFLYKLYDAHKSHLVELERQLADDHENDERIKAQMQEHFETIQRIADTTTLPHVLYYLRCRVDEELNHSVLTERLKQGKNTLTASEKLQLWDRVKVLSFTKIVLSLWSTTMLSLFIRVQVNILGRHLYIDTARSLESSNLLEEGSLIEHDDEQKFLASADFLSNHSLPAAIFNMQAAATEILKSKQLKDVLDTTTLQEIIMQILEMFTSLGRPHHWVEYLMLEDTKFPYLTESASSKNLILTDVSEFEKLMAETRAVLSSDEFRNIAEVSLRTVVSEVVKDINDQFGAGNMSSGIPLVMLLPRVAQISPSLLDEPSKNRYIQIIRSIHEVEVFFTYLYSNIPSL